MLVRKVITGNEHGGAAESTFLLIKGLVSSGSIEIDIICLCKGQFAQTLKMYFPNVTILDSGVPPIISSYSVWYSLLNRIKLVMWFTFSLFKLRKHLSQKRSAVIHTTNNYALIVCALNRFLDNTILLCHWRNVGVRSNLLYRTICSRVDTYICISNFVKASLPLSWQKKAVIIYNGLNIEALRRGGEGMKGAIRSYLKIDDSIPVFGTIGTFSHIKCHSLLIKSCMLLSKEYPEIDYRCVLIGSAPNINCENYLKMLKDSVRDLGLTYKVHFVMDDQIGSPRHIISDFNFFIGSTWNNGLGEGFGLVYVEAMAQALPIIAISVGAAAEIIKPSIGLLIEHNSEKEQKDAIIKLIRDCKLRKKLSESSIEESKKYSINNTVKNLIELYNSIIT